MKPNREDDSLARTDRKTSWLSLGFEDLVRSIATEKSVEPGSGATPFDVLIVGSGYGGSIAAAQFAGATANERPITVCVLERGQEYLPGMFPGTASELAGHMRFSTMHAPKPGGRLDGLFDVRLGPDVNAVVANGLGGGSLINAGAMLKPKDDVLADGFPKDLAGYFDRALAMVGANPYPRDKLPTKGQALGTIAPQGGHAPVAITVGLPERVVATPLRTSANVTLEHCLECGDCATGCNFGAKNSLDLNLLVKAAHHGAEIYTGASVLWIERSEDGDGKHWIVHTVPTNAALRKRHGEPLKIHASKVILAAGTYGSTEILMRSQTEKLKFSGKLGRHFSTNGDMIAVIYGQNLPVNAVAIEGTRPKDRHIGPTITSMIDLRDDAKRPFAIQEIAVPGALRRLFEELFTTAHVLNQLHIDDKSEHVRDGPHWDPCAVDPAMIQSSSVLAVMGDDKAEGAMELVGTKDEACGDGAVLVRWPGLRDGPKDVPNDSLFDRQTRALEELVGQGGAQVLPNPVWRLLPPKLSFLMDEARGPTLTVHPLGGCRIGRTTDEGVVNDLGQVFDATHAGKEIFGSLVVLDGSIIPRALAINPALTISALALRASERLLAGWGMKPAGSVELPQRTRPIFQVKEYKKTPESMFTIVERLSGDVAIGGDAAAKLTVELTIKYEPQELRTLMSTMERALELDKKTSFIRVFDVEAYNAALQPNPTDPEDDQERRLEKAAKWTGTLSGQLRLLHREPSAWQDRYDRGMCKYFRTRAGRDFVHFFWEKFREKGLKRAWADVKERARGARSLATRAGEVRLFEYELEAHMKPSREWKGGCEWKVLGRKRFSYGVPENLWQQLETLEVTHFADRPSTGKLSIDLSYFPDQETPLARVVSQHDLPSSLIEIGAFAGYLTRLFVNVHMWTFRRPEAPRPRVPQRLPQVIKRGFIATLIGNAPPRPRIYEITVGTMPDGYPVRVRLTRYARFDTTEPPVLLIHGYSASGTTFAHTLVRPNLAEILWENRRDVWVADLRTSCGMPTAIHPWAFEDAALVDIPAAIDFMLRELAVKKIDVVAHCMGAAMMSMAILKQPEAGDPLFDMREKLPDSLNRVVLSQVGPLVRFTPINVLRAYVLRYLRHYLGVAAFDFRVKDAPSLAEQLLDRFLSSLRYPASELRIENPMWQIWKRNEFVGSRHRIDALYGRAFSLGNLDSAVLANIDDFFGPLSLETVAQGMYLAQQRVITDRHGRNVYLNRDTRDRRWTFPTLSIHGQDNGLVDVDTQQRIDRYFNYDEATCQRLYPPRIEMKTLEGLGHQDSLIGTRGKTQDMFDAIVEFLGRDDKDARAGEQKDRWLIEPPWIGPHRGLGNRQKTFFAVAAATNRKFGDAQLGVCVAVEKRADGHFWPVELDAGLGKLDSMYEFSPQCDKDGWLSVNLPLQLPAAPAEGVLLLLLYDQPEGIRNQPATFGAMRKRMHILNLLGVPVPVKLGTDGFSIFDPGEWNNTIALHLPALNLIAKDFDLLGTNVSIPAQVRAALKEKSATYWEQAFIPTPRVQQGTRKVEAQIFVASCQYPNGLVDETPAWNSYRVLAKAVGADKLAPPGKIVPNERRLLLLVGDQIYSDATAGLFDPTFEYDRYRKPHEALFSQKEVREVLRQIPTAMMLDDHEIADNWEPVSDDTRPRKSLRAGVEAYKDFQRRAGPDFQKPAGDSPDPLWFTYDLGDVNLFVTDTRTERHVRRSVESDKAKIMSDDQLGKLLAWLDDLHRKPATKFAPKFIASSAIMFPRRISTRRSSLAQGAQPPRDAAAASIIADSWEGYPASMGELLHHIVARQIHNVVFLSGDEHLFCRATAKITDRDTGLRQFVHSIHCSPLYAPFPFANATAADFPVGDRFRFEVPGHGARYECSVGARIERVRSGFTEIRAYNDSGAWHVTVGFHDSDPEAKPPLVQELYMAKR
jgi:cholesterol oxidase